MFTPVFLIVACSAPELAPQTDLAGAQPVAVGPLIEDQANTFPTPAWTAAVPLTIVAPGGENLEVLDKLGVRVEVLQVREGRILVECTGCQGDAKGAQGWMPRGVLWGPIPAPPTGELTAKDPLTLALMLRSRWSQGSEIKDGQPPEAYCVAIDQGWEIQASQAVVKHSEGELRLQRHGSTWSLTRADPPPPPQKGSCG